MVGLRALIVGGVLKLALASMALTSVATFSLENSDLDVMATPAATEKPVEAHSATQSEKLCLDSNLSSFAPRNVAKAVMLETSKSSGEETQGSVLNANPSVTIKTIFAIEDFHLDSELKLGAKMNHLLNEVQSEQLCNDVIEQKDSSGLMALVVSGLGSAAGAQAGTVKEEGLILAVLPGAVKEYLKSACGLLGSSLKYFRAPTINRGEGPLRKPEEAIGNGLGNIILLSEQRREQTRDDQSQNIVSVFDLSRGIVYSNTFCTARERKTGLN